MNNQELETMRKSFKTANTQTNKLLKNPKVQELKGKVQDIRNYSIENNKELFKLAEKNLNNNDIQTFLYHTHRLRPFVLFFANRK